jgi:hypothetical protein
MSTQAPSAAKSYAQQILNRAKSGSQEYSEAAITRALRVTGDIPWFDYRLEMKKPNRDARNGRRA